MPFKFFFRFISFPFFCEMCKRYWRENVIDRLSLSLKSGFVSGYDWVIISCCPSIHTSASWWFQILLSILLAHFPLCLGDGCHGERRIMGSRYGLCFWDHSRDPKQLFSTSLQIQINRTKEWIDGLTDSMPVSCSPFTLSVVVLPAFNVYAFKH